MLSVVHFLGINLSITNNDTLPDDFSRFFEVQVQGLLIFNIPVAFVDLDLLLELSFNYGFLLALDLDLQVLGLNLNNHHLRGCTFGQGHLDVNVLD